MAASRPPSGALEARRSWPVPAFGHNVARHFIILHPCRLSREKARSADFLEVSHLPTAVRTRLRGHNRICGTAFRPVPRPVENRSHMKSYMSHSHAEVLIAPQAAFGRNPRGFCPAGVPYGKDRAADRPAGSAATSRGGRSTRPLPRWPRGPFHERDHHRTAPPGFTRRGGPGAVAARPGG